MKHLFKKLCTSGLFWLWITIVFLLIDRASKIWVMDHLQLFEPLKIAPFFNFTLAYNTGAAFNFLESQSGWQTWFFTSLALIVSIIVLVWLSRLAKREYWINVALCLILTGAIGNAWDRLHYGFVVDFLDFHLGDWHFAIFNVADSGVCVGAFMLILNWFFESRRAAV